MKSSLLKIAATATVYGAPLLAFAQPESSTINVPSSGITTVGGFISIFTGLINWFFYIVLLVAVVFFIYAGFVFITSSGDETKTTQAKNMILWAVVGVGVALLASAFIYLAQGITGVSSPVPVF